MQAVFNRPVYALSISLEQWWQILGRSLQNQVSEPSIECKTIYAPKNAPSAARISQQSRPNKGNSPSGDLLNRGQSNAVCCWRFGRHFSRARNSHRRQWHCAQSSKESSRRLGNHACLLLHRSAAGQHHSYGMCSERMMKLMMLHCRGGSDLPRWMLSLVAVVRWAGGPQPPQSRTRHCPGACRYRTGGRRRHSSSPRQ